MKFNKTLFIFFTILIIVSFVVALPTDDFDKLKKRDLDNDLKELISKHDVLKGYSVDELKKIVHSQGLEKTINPNFIDVPPELIEFLFKQALKQLGSAIISRCRTNRCEVPFCHEIACANPNLECCAPMICPLKFPRVGGRC